MHDSLHVQKYEPKKKFKSVQWSEQYTYIHDTIWFDLCTVFARIILFWLANLLRNHLYVLNGLFLDFYSFFTWGSFFVVGLFLH